MGRYKNDGSVPEQLAGKIRKWQESQGGSRQEYNARRQAEAIRQEQQRQQAEKTRQEMLSTYDKALNPRLSEQDILRGVELNYARKAEQEAKQQYEGYKQSDQRETDWKKTIREAVMSMGAPGSGLDLELGKLPEKTVPEAEKGYAAVESYYTQNRKATEDRHMMERDVAQVEAMSNQDRRLLETYAYGRTEWLDHQKIADSISARADLEKKYGKQRVEELAESWQRYQNALSAQKNIQQTKEGAGDGFWAGAGHSAASVVANAMGSLSAPLGYLNEALGRTGRYQTLDPNNAGAMPGQYASAVREAVSEDMGGVGKVLYHGTMGAMDNLVRIAMGGGTKVGTLGLAALGSFGSTLSEASARGATPGEAVLLGVANAGIELATEKLSLDELFKAGKSGLKGAKQLFGAALKQGGVEATEEELSFLGGLAADALVLREKSAYNQQIGELVANGMSYKDAKAQADRALWDEAVNTALTSFVSGGLMEGAQAGGWYLAQQQKSATGNATAPENATVSKTEAVGEDSATTEKPTAEEYIDAMAEGFEYHDAALEQAGAQDPADDGSQEAINRVIGVPAQKNTAQQSANESTGIKQQIQASQETLAGMEPVAQISTPREFAGMNIAEKMKWVIEKLRPTNYQVDRKGFGIINFSAKQIKQAFKYFPKGGAEEASFEAIPYVLENGMEISSHENHKGREYSTVTFAAPVTINGKRGNMAVVVKQTTDNRYKIHRVFSPDGSVFDLSETTVEAEPTPGGGVTENGSLATPISSASDDIIADARENVNGQYAPQGAPEGFEAMGAASAGFSPYTDLQIEYGNIPEGENPVRPDDAPISTDGTDRVSYTARTAIGAEVTPDEFVPLIENEVVRGGFSFIPITNDQTVQNAVQNIQAEGWRTARANWTAQVRQGRTGADITATGALLYNHAVNSGDYQEAMDILLDYQQAVRNAAQAVQAARILKRLTPENRLYMIRRSIQRMVEDMHLNREITIDEDLARRYQETRDNAEADRILDEIARDVARQIPPTLGERITALRYLNMLGNFRTQVRNLAGNLGAKFTYLAKDELAATIEGIASGLSGGRIQRTKVNWVDRTTRRAARADFENVADWISGGGRANDRGTESDDFARRVQEHRRILPAGLEQYRRATNWAMNNEYFGDAAFGREAYARALAGYLNARGIRTDNFDAIDRDTLNQAREYAVRQAQEATFRDNNQVSTFVSSRLRDRNTPAWARVIGEAIMPFRKTPANVLVRAEEFSPLGLINSAVNTVRAARGDISGAELVESWAKTLTGTGLFAIGWALANMGYLRGGPDEDEEKAAFDKLNGYQDYALVLPDGTNLTIDFFSPAAMPMLLGAQFDKILNGTDLTWADLEGVFSTLADPMIEMSMLSGVNDTIDAIRYADNSLGQFLVNASVNYLTQALGNTLMGQMERSTEESRMTTYIDKDSNVPVWLQRNLGKLSQKIPGWDYQQTEYIDQWGREQKNPRGIANWLYNLLSPSYIDKGNVDAVANELYRLDKAQTGTNVFPQSPETQISYTDSDGNRHDKYNLSMDELDKLKRTEGQTQAKLVADLIGGEDYKALTDAQKAKAVSLAYDYAREFARGQVLPGYDGMDSWMEGIEGKEAAAIVQKVAAAEMTDAFGAITQAWREGYEDDSEARESLENAFSVFDGLTPAAREAIAQDTGGRLGYYLAAKKTGMETETFVDLYRKYWEIDQGEKTTSQKAQEWSYALEKAFEARTITNRQRDVLKDKMVYMQKFPAETEKFDQLTESGISADDAQDLGWLIQGLKIQEGYKEVRPVQKAEAIAGSSLSESDKIAALKIYGNDSQDENLNLILEMGGTSDDYVAAWLIYAREDAAGGKGTKERTIQAFMEELGVNRATAAAIYDIYH